MSPIRSNKIQYIHTILGENGAKIAQKKSLFLTPNYAFIKDLFLEFYKKNIITLYGDINEFLPISTALWSGSR